MAAIIFPPSATSPVSSPQLDSLQPVAASPQFSRASASIQLSASPTPATIPPPSHLRQRPALSTNSSSRLSAASLSFTLLHRDSFVPQFPSSLSYTSVRDFAYPNLHPLHYGPQPSTDTPVSSYRGSQYLDSGANGGGGWFSGNSYGYNGSSSQYRRLSDPAYPSFGTEEKSGEWVENWTPGLGKFSMEDGGKPNHLPALHFQDGPPWSEDPDLHSPVIISTKHRKQRSVASHTQSSHTNARRPSKNSIGDLANGEWRDESCAPEQALRTNSLEDMSDGEPGGEFHNHPGGQAYYRSEQTTEEAPVASQVYSQGSEAQDYYSEDDGMYSEDGEDDDFGDPSRLSNQYFITIASPAEEMHGKAVALFDFQKENENELGLVEGQVIWVSYRHGMGWLVAEDPKTRESGLVPEEYVRLLRDIQQPLFVEGSGTEEEVDGGADFNPTSNSPPPSSYSNGMKPVVSTFSTSSQDVHPYQGPLHHLGEQVPPRYFSRSGPGGQNSQLHTPIAGGWEGRIEALERARERALMEKPGSYTAKSGSLSGGSGDDTPRAGHGGGWGTGRRDSGESDAGVGKHRRKDSQLAFLDEVQEAYETHNEQKLYSEMNELISNKGKERAIGSDTETLPSTSLSTSDLSTTQETPSYGLGIDLHEATKASSH